MIRAGIAHPVSIILITLLTAPYGFGQTPAPAAATPAALPTPPRERLTIAVLEGNNAVNSISLLSSVAAVIEVRDPNDFPVENASVTFTLPDQGPGGVFVGGGKTFSTRSDARGQAIAPVIIPAGAGKFKIVVTASVGDRRGEVAISQTNSEGSYVGPPLPSPAWYKRKLFWALAGGAVAAIVVVVVLHNSSSKTVVVTPGSPVIVP